MSNDIVIREFREFGKRMNIILICLILNILLSWLVIPGIIMFIYSLLVLGNIKRINEQLNDPNLKKFRSYFIISVTIIIFTTIIIVIVMIPFIIGLVTYFISIDPASMASMTPEQIMTLLQEIMIYLIPIIIIAIVGLVIILIASILQMQAWDNLNSFFRQNSGLFPDNLAYEAIEGSKNLKTAALCNILFFLIITILIGLIYQILGYMKLSRLKNLGYSPSKPSVQPQIAPQATSKDGIRYCPECGSKVKESENFCNACGSKL